jgi:hypothetical protein
MLSELLGLDESDTPENDEGCSMCSTNNLSQEHSKRAIRVERKSRPEDIFDLLIGYVGMICSSIKDRIYGTRTED